jgi:phosphoribosylaminoimidazolecarboxamide formyltransferase/IMP cyclohydrolase
MEYAIKKALISVSDKSGVTEFAKELSNLEVQILSTGGTAKTLRAADIPVTGVSVYTGFPEMMDGRVKTLHPKIYGGLLALRDNETHMEEAGRNGIKMIDLVAVNLYPFQQTIAKQGVKLEEAIENIDIGGPAMLRAAAKNYRNVVVICDPTDYVDVLSQIEETGNVRQDTRQRLAVKVFEHTNNYDKAIAQYLKTQFK